jgi:FKBP-type peptidyl-prolyl cis-trans isomerase
LKEGFVRKTTALIVALGLLAALSACSSDASAAGCGTAIAPGDASAAVTATGSFQKAPKIDFPTPLIAKTNQKSEVITGKGDYVKDGQPVLVDVSILNGADGKVLQKTSYDATGGSLITLGKSDFPAVSEGLECSRVGSRVVIVGSPKDSHSGQADAANGIGKNDSFVYVVDVKRAFPAKADGAGQVPQSGMPAVVLAPNGAPGITVPNESAPKSLKVNVLQAGHGKKVKSGDYAILKYTGILWKDSTVFDSTWTGDKKGQAAALQITSGTVVPGFAKGLIGQRVGSQVLLVIPPKDGYGAQGSDSVPANSTLVFVVDILGIA